MKSRTLSIFACGFLSITALVHANEVLFTANQPSKIIFRIAHLNHNHQPVLGQSTTTRFNDYR